MNEGKPTETFTGEGRRRLDCPSYGQCLNYAGAQDWPGWTCEQCPNLKDKGTILSDSLHFFCKKFGTTLSEEACLKRQQRAPREIEKNPNSDISISLSNCLKCPQGKELAMSETSPVEKKDLPLCQDCGVNPADGFGGKRCRSCQGRRGAAATNKIKARRTAENNAQGSESIGPVSSKAQPKATPPEPQNRRITIDFEQYPDLFEEFKALSRESFRPLEYQLCALVGEAVKQRRVPTETT
jgi:hypothetical protein